MLISNLPPKYYSKVETFKQHTAIVLHHLQCKVLVQLICNRLLTQKCLVHPKEDLNFPS